MYKNCMVSWNSFNQVKNKYGEDASVALQIYEDDACEKITYK